MKDDYRKYLREIEERLVYRLAQEFGNHDLVKEIVEDQFEKLNIYLNNSK